MSEKININEDMTLLEGLLHSKKLNYNRLMPIMQQYVSLKRDYKTVNIFIDVENILKRLYNPNVIKEFQTMKSKSRWQITSEIINIASHYRHFFLSRMWKYTNFYFYYSDKKSSYHINLFDDYRSEYYNRRLVFNKANEYSILNKSIKENMKIISAFLEYVPHCYFINSGEIEPSLVPYILLNEEIALESEYNLLISNEEIYFQDLVKFDLMQLLIKGDKSRIITKENIWEEITSGMKNPISIDILPELYQLLLALTGYKIYSVPNVKNLGNARGLKLIQELLSNSVISEIEYTSEMLYEKLKNYKKFSSEDLDKLILNYKLLSHSEMEKIAYNKMDIENIKDNCNIELVDAKTVRQINERYFNNFPILIDYLFEGEEYE